VLALAVIGLFMIDLAQKRQEVARRLKKRKPKGTTPRRSSGG
jgi:hypothetical protein